MLQGGIFFEKRQQRYLHFNPQMQNEIHLWEASV